MKEIWKSVPGYEKFYLISNLGRIKRLMRIRRSGLPLYEKILNPGLSRGYPRIRLTDENGKKRRFLVHRLVGMAFIPNIENKPEINHLDGIRNNNHVSNLEWATRTDQMQHAIRTGLMEPTFKNGEKNLMSKLSQRDVFEIIKRWDTNNFSKKDLAKIFSVSPVTIESIIYGQRWNKITNRRGNYSNIKSPNKIVAPNKYLLSKN